MIPPGGFCIINSIQKPKRKKRKAIKIGFRIPSPKNIEGIHLPTRPLPDKMMPSKPINIEGWNLQAVVPLPQRVEPLQVEATFGNVPVNYPMKIDLYSHLRALLSEDDYINMNIKGVREESVSLRQTDFTHTIADGVLTYHPKGNFLRNILIVDVEISNPTHLPTLRGIENNDVYRDPDAPNRGLQLIGDEPADTTPLRPADPGEDAPPPIEVEVPLAIDGLKIFGDPDEVEKFWQDQESNGTCLFISMLASMQALKAEGSPHAAGIPDNILEDMETKLVLDASLVDDYGRPLYPDQLPEGFILTEGGYVPYIRNQFGKGLIDVNFRHDNHIYDLPKKVFDEYGVPSSTEYFSDLGSIIQNLQEGNKIIAVIDAQELWYSEVGQSLLGQEPPDGFHPLLTGENHAMWITGVELNEDGVFIVLNDSEGPSGAVRMPLKEFVEAFEDSEFMGFVAGEAPTKSVELQAERNSLAADLQAFYQKSFERSGITPHVESIEAVVRNSYRRDQIDRLIPGFAERALAYTTAVAAETRDLLSDYFTEEEIDELNSIFLHPTQDE